METKGTSKDGRMGVSLSKEIAQDLLELKEKLTGELGVNLSVTQVVEYLISQYKQRQSDQ